MSKIGVMVCGHGSRDPEAIAEFAAVATGIAQRLPQFPVASGFLEFARPIIRDGLDRLRGQGVSRILAVPGMLLAAGHVKDDIPSVLNRYQAEHGVRVDYGRDLGVDLKLIRAAGQRIEEAEARAAHAVPRDETLLLVVGRGTSDPDANSNIAKVARMLGEGMGFGWTETCYSGVTFPLVAPGLEHAVKLGYRRIVVFPYFLFTGVLVKRIYRIADVFAERFPAIEFVKASYLNDHPLVLDAFAERVEGILAGDTAMNCQMCKYRDQVLGFEAAVGAPQFSHHHHVEGVGTDADHRHHHEDDHDHHHHHDEESPPPLWGRVGRGAVTGALATSPLPTSPTRGEGIHVHDHSHSHDHDHDHDHDHNHHHHHDRLPHPHALHPHGPGRRDPDATE